MKENVPLLFNENTIIVSKHSTFECGVCIKPLSVSFSTQSQRT
jgi:hypothetical protein